MMNLIEFAGIAIVVNMVAHWYKPIQGFKSQIVDKLPLWVAMPLICSKCLGFIFCLVWYQNLPMAALLSFVSYVIENAIYFIDLTREEK
jgi:hypothetical protein